MSGPGGSNVKTGAQLIFTIGSTRPDLAANSFIAAYFFPWTRSMYCSSIGSNRPVSTGMSALTASRRIRRHSPNRDAFVSVADLPNTLDTESAPNSAGRLRHGFRFLAAGVVELVIKSPHHVNALYCASRTMVFLLLFRCLKKPAKSIDKLLQIAQIFNILQLLVIYRRIQINTLFLIG